MNATQIAALYTPYVASLLTTPTPAAEQELLTCLRLRREDTALAASYEVRVRDFAPLGTDLDQRCPQRVFAWALAQLPATDQRQPGGESWSAMVADYTAPKGAFEIRFSIGADFTTLLRGVRHYQRKLNRGTKKLLAQLRTYHRQQLAEQLLAATSAAASALDALAAGHELSCLHLPLAEHERRVELAEELEEQIQLRAGRPNGKYGREIMWHPLFAAEFTAAVSGMQLPLIAAYLGHGLARDMNQGRALNLADYAYLADCLREGQADNPAPLPALRLARALAWVEQAGTTLLATQAAQLTPAGEATTPYMAVA